jgi:autotransporter-associated beta strand protein
LLAAGAAQATVYTWTGAGGNNRMNTADNWDSAPAFDNTADLIMTTGTGYPEPGSTYGNITARSITFTNITAATYGFGINRSATFTRSLTMSADSGNATMAVDSGVSADVSITGTTPNTGIQNAIVLDSDLDIVHNGSGNFNLSARITGANGITKTGAGTLRLSSDQNDYTGNTVVNEGRLTLLSGGQLFYDIGAAGENNSLSGDVGSTGDVVLNGAFRFDLTSASTTLGDSWLIVDDTNLGGGISFTDGEFIALSTVGSFVGSAGVWKISENGTEYEFSESTGTLTVIPEPATLGLVATFGFGVLVIRRRFMI